MRNILFTLVGLLLAFALGVQFQRTIGVNSLLHQVGLRTLYISDTSDRQVVDRSEFQQVDLVLLSAGQSNAANHSNFSPRPAPQLLNYFDGELYSASAPLLGASGEGGNLLTEIGNQLVLRDVASRVLLAPQAIGNTSVTEWGKDSEHYARLLQTLDELKDLVSAPIVLLWIQGEKDSRDGIPAERFANELDNIFAGLLQEESKLQIIVASHTGCRQLPVQSYGSVDRRLAGRQRVTVGPRLDMLSADLRYDGCHWNEAGVVEIGAAVAATIQNALAKNSMHLN